MLYQETVDEAESPKSISMLRAFTVFFAGLGAFCAALHVFIGYMSLDKTPNETTGIVPSLFDNTEYLYYTYIAVLFFVTAVLLSVLRRIPSVTLLPAAANVTYLLLLFDAEILLKGKMTFILLALFVFAGCAAVALFRGGRLHRDLYCYMIASIGLFPAGWAIAIYFRAPLAEAQLFGAYKPVEELDGRGAVLAYERLRSLAELMKADLYSHYLWAAIPVIVAVALFLFLPKRRLLVRICALLSVPYALVAFSFERLTYFPMFCVVPFLLCFAGIYAFTAFDPMEEEVGSVSVAEKSASPSEPEMSGGDDGDAPSDTEEIA